MATSMSMPIVSHGWKNSSRRASESSDPVAAVTFQMSASANSTIPRHEQHDRNRDGEAHSNYLSGGRFKSDEPC
jgi:hypothetical protein